MIRVPFFLLFGFNKGALNQKGQKGTTQEPRLRLELLLHRNVSDNVDSIRYSRTAK